MESKYFCLVVLMCAMGQVAPQMPPATMAPATMAPATMAPATMAPATMAPATTAATTAAMPIAIPIQIPIPTQIQNTQQAPFGQFGQALGFAAGQFVTAPKRVLAGFITGILNSKLGGTTGILPINQLPINQLPINQLPINTGVTQNPLNPIPINTPIAIQIPIPVAGKR